MTLQEQLNTLPDSFGVYHYFDANGKLLYIGKAKSLKNRVRSYFRFTPTLIPSPELTPRIHKMISEVVSLSTIVVGSESDALILENSLIKQLKPKYNILLRDDKTYPYLYVDMSELFPRIELTRKVVNGKAIRYFGPFSTGGRDILNALYEVVPLVQKKGCLREGKRCLFYQIGKCYAPCEKLFTSESYSKILEEAIILLNNKTKLIKKLKEKMAHYAQELRFEEAGKLRDQITAITNANVVSAIDMASRENIDVFAYACEGERSCIVKMFVREGKVVSSSHLFINGITELGDIYKQVILDFYDPNSPISSFNVVIGDDFDDRDAVEILLKERMNSKMTLSVPKMGARKRIVDVARANAAELLRLENSKLPGIELQLASWLGIDTPLKRIECFDASHHSGSIPVGAMVVWEEGKFIRGDYRHYNLTTTDEYAQMREMLTRRVESFEKSSPPDLWLIDGGTAQVRLAEEILVSCGVCVPVIGIAKEKIDTKAHRAKGGANDKIYTTHDVFSLGQHDRRLLTLQTIRDETHRFVITFHRNQKQKTMKKTALLGVEGIGEGRVKKLLDYFGTFDAIQKATLEELAHVVPRNIAEKIVKGTSKF